MKNGVPWFNAGFDRDLQLDDAEILAAGVVFGEFEGQCFNWSAMQWETRE